MNKKGVFVLLDDELAREFDSKRGLIPKATYLRQLIINDLNGRTDEHE